MKNIDVNKIMSLQEPIKSIVNKTMPVVSNAAKKIPYVWEMPTRVIPNQMVNNFFKMWKPLSDFRYHKFWKFGRMTSRVLDWVDL